MKIILSRKGFDSSYGGVASPILPDGTLLSLPIPDEQGTVTYGELTYVNHPLGPLVEELTRGRITRQRRAHLDPDLAQQIVPRSPGWQPLFGQDGAAQSHLANQGVGIGDLFLFFGWFRAVQKSGSGYQFVPGAPDQHLIYGWLQVGAILQGSALPAAAPPWAINHPHCIGGRGERNTLYIAADRLQLPGRTRLPSLAGAGNLSFSHRQLLTNPNALRTQWRLPRWFYPTAGRPPLTYHADLARWSVDEAYAYLRSATRGQEFVFDTSDYPEAIAWAETLLTANAVSSPS